jgi:hypothetical protein
MGVCCGLPLLLRRDMQVQMMFFLLALLLLLLAVFVPGLSIAWHRVASHRIASHGMAWHGMAWHGMLQGLCHAPRPGRGDPFDALARWRHEHQRRNDHGAGIAQHRMGIA